jgi:hypothetical protein
MQPVATGRCPLRTPHGGRERFDGAPRPCKLFLRHQRCRSPGPGHRGTKENVGLPSLGERHDWFPLGPLAARHVAVQGQKRPMPLILYF